MSAPLLELDRCTVQFGGLKAVSDVSLEIGEGELVGLIGPNGAGKTTVFNMITGVYRPTSGKVNFRGTRLAGKRPCQITAQGIARTFQNIRLFNSLSVYDNVRTAFNLHLKHRIIHALTRARKFIQEETEVHRKVFELLEIFGLERHADANCRSLPYGDQRKLEIVRALATKPKLLLLDEPAAGMNPTEKEELMRLIRFVHEKFHLSVLLVEHDMKVVMGICERVAVLDHGVKIAEGNPVNIQNDPTVIEAYLGKKPETAEPVRILEHKAATPAAPMLEVRGLEVAYRGIPALHGISLEVPTGSIVTLIGANGAGKSTTLRAISGLVKSRAGEILFEGKSIAGLPPHRIVDRRLAHVPEGRMIFANLTVRENLHLGAYLSNDAKREKEDMDYVYSVFPRLKERERQVAGTLSGGEQQMLAIGRALMSEPKFLMLDEPSLGIAPILVQTIFEKIVEINQTHGITVLLVEQNANLALEVSHFGYVLETGRVLLAKSSEELRKDPEVRAAYLGAGS